MPSLTTKCSQLMAFRKPTVWNGNFLHKVNPTCAVGTSKINRSRNGQARQWHEWWKNMTALWWERVGPCSQWNAASVLGCPLITRWPGTSTLHGNETFLSEIPSHVYMTTIAWSRDSGAVGFLARLWTVSWATVVIPLKSTLVLIPVLALGSAVLHLYTDFP